MRQEDERQVQRERVLPLHWEGKEDFFPSGNFQYGSSTHSVLDRNQSLVVPFSAQVQLSLGDFVAARRSLKKALLLGSQQPLDKQAVKKAFRNGKMLFTVLCFTVTDIKLVCIILSFTIQRIRAVNWKRS